MAYQTGNATGPANLFALFRTFITSHADLLNPAGDGSLPSQAWAELKYTVNGDAEEIYLRGPGNNTDQNVYVNTAFGPDAAAASDAWAFNTRGATSFDTSVTLTSQPGVDPNPKVMMLGDQPVQYWFFANGRRYIIVAQVTASVYTNTYAGLLRPFEPVSAALAYPYPLYIGASMGELGYRFSEESNVRHHSFWNPAYTTTTTGSAAVYSANNVWYGISNYKSNGLKEALTQATPLVAVTAPYSDIGGIAGFQTENMEPLLGGGYLLTDVEIAFSSRDWHGYRERYGVLDGVAHLTGISQSVLNTITIGADTFIVFQEAFRTGQSDYVAIKQ